MPRPFRYSLRFGLVGPIWLLMAAPCGADAQANSAVRERRAVLQLTIGDDSGLNDHNFGGVSSVRASSDGRLYVLDGRECHIKAFSNTGAYIKTFGHSGAGPGEFSCQAPEFDVHGDTIQVRDLIQKRTVQFSLDGQHIRTALYATLEGESGPVRSVQLRHGYLFRAKATVASIGAEVRFDPWVYLTLRRPPASPEDTIARFRIPAVLVTPRGVARGARPAMTGASHGGAYAISGDSMIAMVDGYSGKVTWYDVSATGIQARRTAGLGVAGRPISASEMRAMEERVRQLPRWRTSNVGFSDAPTQHSVADRALFAAEQALWVSLSESGDGQVTWTVLPPGAATYSVRLPSEFQISFIAGDRVYGSGTTAIGSPIVQIFQIRP